VTGAGAPAGVVEEGHKGEEAERDVGVEPPMAPHAHAVHVVVQNGRPCLQILWTQQRCTVWYSKTDTDTTTVAGTGQGSGTDTDAVTGRDVKTQTMMPDRRAPWQTGERKDVV